ncbi:CNNM metal transporter family protein, partial [Klebsiella pneumoniae]
DVLELSPLQFTIIEANDYRVDLVRVVKLRQYNDEEE